MAQELNLIECPKCAHEFSLTDQMSKDIEKDVEKRFQKKLEKIQSELALKAEALEKEKTLLEKQKESVDKEVQKLLQKEKILLESKIKASLSKEMTLEMQDLKTQIKEKEHKINEAVKNELELRKKARDLEAREKQIELDTQRKLDAQRTVLEEELRKRIGEEFQLKATEKDLKLESMKKQIEELKRKSEQGSQQAQGEAMEVEVEKLLGDRFPIDSFEPIAKGQRGADVLQIIHTPTGQEAGKILYESKNTKNWSDGWITKAKDDQRDKKAELVVIITESLPKEIDGFGCYEGVWVTNFRNHLCLAEALRFYIIEVFHARSAATGKGEKLDCLYRYMSETQFKQRIEAIIEAFKAMRDSLEGEKRAMQRIWANREKCLERVLSNTAGMYGDIQGIIGSSLPRVEMLELESVPLLEAAETEE